MDDLQKLFLETFESEDRELSLAVFIKIRTALESGEIRVAEKVNGEWIVNTWIKSAILWGFRIGIMKEYQGGGWNFYDKDTYPVLDVGIDNNVRLVPGGTSVRSGAYVAKGTVIMPPSYINVGAYVDSGTMIDSHALVGSCAQIGKGVHLSAASQIGGVLEPVGALPVIVEDNVFIGGNCGIYEGTIIREGAVIGSGVILNASTALFDNVRGHFIEKEPGYPLVVPDNAVVIAGSRPVTRGHGNKYGIHIYTPVIVKYRDDKTDKSITLEDVLR
ncbi:MAG: 2,3,4,5-tetrahydropyridine-2,6-dicarboxylate N-succinyltransferase [Deltaproteobacteria bacterium]